MQEWEDKFLALFPHRYDYIWAEHPAPHQRPEWKTESRHPLSDRLIRQNSYLYGVRFGAETTYCLLDADIKSIYHPNQDPFAIDRIIAALEPLGLVSYVACTSSYSNGLHLYFPFQQAQSSRQIAIAVATLLENAGFKLLPGQLEVFPNPKPYSAGTTLSLFNAHRLPMQAGSYLVDKTFQPIWSSQERFVQQWEFAQSRNELDTKTLKQVIKQARRQHFRISGKADKFLNDLNAEIEIGWTGPSQTNRLLGRITMRAFIFEHILSGGEPLEGQALIEEIVRTARLLPGYQEWCRHQHEIEHRAEEWVRCIENSHYFHYGDPEGKLKAQKDPQLEQAIEQAPNWNQQQSAAARDRIRRAIADLLEKNALPAKATARFHALLTYGIGGSSLYRHRQLWHPNYLIAESEQALANDPIPPSLFSGAGGDTVHSNDSGDRTVQANEAIAGNCAPQSVDDLISSAFDKSNYTQPALFALKDWAEMRQEANRTARRQRRRIQQERSHATQITRMQRFLHSGDPVLVAEALAWAQINPGVIDRQQLALPLDVLTAIAQQVQRLGWSPPQLSDRLDQHLGKRSLSDLTLPELLQCLQWLSHV
ncbi:hypothetical protein H6F67_26785 [Microcoleus sp. FACHB-1515]|uniref:hypothetical protein n=1 Tax=Cyanophyceae TaxID=3028117 RepID=UPI001689289D|nr:hypothetical protein [Microcoleus sp. FACHB-1515]MBD2093451.1 hypothetical protein [Microcoleus sp. FACHB-1515]